MSTATQIQDIRFRPLGRGSFVGGFVMTLLIHAGLGGLVWYSTFKEPPREEAVRDVVITQMVKLGKEREKFWLPRIVQPPQPKVVEPEIKVATDPTAPPVEKEKEKEKPPEKPKEYSKKVEDVLNRRRDFLRNASEEPDIGSPLGSRDSTASQAVEGDPYMTAIYNAIRRNWSVPTGMSMGTVVDLVTEIRISVGEDGKILNPRMTKSSGSTLFDASCMQAVQATAQVDPPPPNKRAMIRRGVVLAFDGKDLAR